MRTNLLPCRVKPVWVLSVAIKRPFVFERLHLLAIFHTNIIKTITFSNHFDDLRRNSGDKRTWWHVLGYNCARGND